MNDQDKLQPAPFAVIPEWVMDCTTPTEERVYLYLVRYANAERVCWPSHATLAQRTRFSVRTVQRAIKGLVAKGCLSVSPRVDADGQTSNLYIVRHERYDLPPIHVTSDRPPHDTSVTPPMTPVSPELEPLNESHIDSHTSRKAPKAFDVTDALREWARSKGIGVDLDRETEQFLDYHRAKGSKMKDWTAAWRTWMRNAQKWSGETAGVDPASGRRVNLDA